MRFPIRAGVCTLILALGGWAVAEDEGDAKSRCGEPGQEAMAPCPEVPSAEEVGVGGAGLEVMEEPEAVEESPQWLRGISVQVGGGVEGYTGQLAPQIQPGPAYGAQVLFKPTPLIGLEAAYSGAVNEVDLGLDLDNGAADGADIVRNGGSATVNVAITRNRVQPYVLGGIGFSRYNAREGTENFGFEDDTSGHIPVGLGVRAHAGGLVADLRGVYNVLFDTDFAQNVSPHEIVGVNSIAAGRYAGTLSVGYVF